MKGEIKITIKNHKDFDFPFWRFIFERDIWFFKQETNISMRMNKDSNRDYDIVYSSKASFFTRFIIFLLLLLSPILAMISSILTPILQHKKVNYFKAVKMWVIYLSEIVFIGNKLINLMDIKGTSMDLIKVENYLTKN